MKLIGCTIFALIVFITVSNGQVHNNGNLKMHDGANMGIFGNFSNNGDFIDNQGTLHAVGSDAQTFSGTSPIQLNDFNIDKSSDALHLDNVLQISGVLTFVKGLVLTDHANADTEHVEFLNGATYSGEDNSSHIDGVVRKTGNSSFVFPTGDNSKLRTIAISAPASVTDHFTAYYVEGNPGATYNGSSLGLDLDHVSGCEYWVLNRTGGSSNVEVTLSWDSNSCGVDNLCDLRVARWDGAQWTSEGNGGISGNLVSGNLVSGTGCSVSNPVTSFSPFTLGSSSSDNPLPISLLSFEAELCERSVCLEWETASERNNDFFTVEKSYNRDTWNEVAKINGAGNSQSLLEYKTIDNAPYQGISYYRLKQTDFNGDFEYSAEVVVNIEDLFEKIKMFPNPAKDIINIKGLSSQLNYLKIFNLTGQEVTSSAVILQNSKGYLQLDVSALLSGVYNVKVNNQHSSFIKQ